MAPRAGLPLFLAVSFGAAWLAALPLWLLGSGLDDRLLTTLCAGLMMAAPAVAVLAVRIRHRGAGGTWRGFARWTGVTLGPRANRTLAVCGAVWVGAPLFVVVTTAIAALLGLIELDLVELSLFRGTLAEMGADRLDLPMPGPVFALVMLVGVLPSALVNSVPAFGEEWGWRGWLLPRLAGRGVAAAVLVSGVVWGLWHAPLTLLGYNFEELGPWAALMMVPFCVAMGAVLCWTRLATGSVWPAVLAHGGFNAAASLVVMVGDASAPPNMALGGPLGVVGTALMALIAVVLFRAAPPKQAETPVDPRDAQVGRS